MSDLYAVLPIRAQNWICGLAGRRRTYERFTPHFHDTLAHWERTIDAPLDALVRGQAVALARLIDHARAHVPFYTHLPPPASSTDPAEAIALTLASIPPLDKETYRTNAKRIRATNLPRRRLVHVKTSGTTGTALDFWQTRERLAEWYAVAWRQRRLAGVALDDPHLTFGGQAIVPLQQVGPPFWRHNRPGRQTLFSAYHLSPANLPAYVDAVHAAPARWAQGYPSTLALVARAMLDAGRPLPRGRLAGVFTSSETLHDFQRTWIEAAFGAPVYDYYSSAEMAVSMTGCRERRLHVDMEFCVVEVEVSERAPGCERGELVVTGLGNDATPLLRYRIGDIGTRATDPCPCGRAGDSFLAIDGRVEDYVVTPDGRRIGRMDHVFKDDLCVVEAQFVQERTTELVLRFVPRPGFDEASRRRLEHAVRARVGNEIALVFEPVDRLPRNAGGKVRAVVSRVGRLGP